MENHSRKSLIIVWVLGLVIGLFLGGRLWHREQTVSTTTISVVDTIRYYKPTPIETASLTNNRSGLPRLLFAPADTIVTTIVDSVEVSFPIEQREYKDSTYRAVISGAVVGGRRPTLDFIETYNRTTLHSTIVQPKKVRPYIGASVGVFGAWSVGVGGGLLIKDHHAVGAEYERTKAENLIKLRYSYIF